jgi:hypothetical protein
MGFILILVLSISTLVRVESNEMTVSLKQVEARANAQFAAMIALGNLQKLAGPDQRVTARADVVVDPDALPLEGTAHWTGVWSSKLNANGAPLNDSFDVAAGLNAHRPQWLVSGAQEDLNNLLDASTNAITASPTVLGERAVRLVRQNGSVNTSEQEVVVLKQSIEGNSGFFAYWVSDEGVKARVNLVSPFQNNSTISDAAYFNFAVAQVADPTAATDGEGNQPYFTSGTSLWKTGGSAIDAAITPQMLPLIGAEGDPGEVYRAFFHEFTTSSRSVIANARDGGLKQDLSSALLNPAANGLTGPIFPAVNAGSPSVGDPGGPNWAQLSDYYIQTLVNNPSSSSIAFRAPSASGGRDRISITPVVTRFQLMVQVFAARAGWYVNPSISSAMYGGSVLQANWPEVAENYDYRVGVFPMITLWNPYDKPMTFDSDLGMETDFSGVALVLNEENRGRPRAEYPADGTIVTLGYPGVLGIILNDNDLLENSDDFDKDRRKIGFTLRTNGLTIPPGRAVNFSPPLNSTIHLSDATQNVLVPGASGEYINGFFSAGATIVDRSLLPGPGVTDPAARIAYEDGGWHEFFPLVQSGPNIGMPLMPGNTARSKISFIAQRNLDRHEVRLYRQPFSGVPNPNDRFYTMVIDDLPFGRHFAAQDNASPRVVRAWEASETAGRVGHYNWIRPQGASVGAPFDDLISPISINDVYRHVHPQRNLNGIARFMAMPDLNQRFGQGEAIHLMTQFNPRAPLVRSHAHLRAQDKVIINGIEMFPFMYDFMQPTQANRWTDPSLRPADLTDFFTAGIDFDDIRFSHVGMNIEMDLGRQNLQMILFEAPVHPPLSIGQFMHANLMNVGHLGPGSTSAPFGSNLQQPVTGPAYAIGNSFASVHLPLDQTRVQIRQNSPMFAQGFSSSNFTALFAGNLTGAHYDYSYELNDALWDNFFMSTQLPTGTSGAVSFLPNGLLPNARIELWSADSTDPDLRNSRRAAAKLALIGGFNVNSTSVAAWASVLGALRDVATLGVAPSNANLRHSFARFTAPRFQSVSDLPSYADSDDLISASRSLTDEQINALAESIVREIRSRRSANGHPFLSLSEFVNRSINADDIAANDRRRFAHTGALQSAIDQSAVNGRPGLDAFGQAQSGGEGIWEAPYIGTIPNTAGPYRSDSLEVIQNRGLFEGAPGALTQADVLSKIGSILVPRSDTFTIRSYGEALDQSTGNVRGKAYLEITVQRTPDYLVSAEGGIGDEAFDLATVSENQRFGRSFTIISSRWVMEDDI